MSKVITSIKLCNYCGSTCDAELVELKGYHYCCYGCATLDDVVSKIKNAPQEVNIQYKQYDLPENFDRLVDFQNDKLYRININLPSIHCSSCIEILEDLPTFNKQVLQTTVNFETKTANILVYKALPLSELAQLLDDIGYPPQLSISQKQKQLNKKSQKELLFKMAFAGFCFGNIMLLSMPHYFGLSIASDLFFSRLFQGLSMALSIPVVLYAGREYLTSAYKSLSLSRAHINVPIAIGILSLWIWSYYEILSGTGLGYLDSLAGLIFFLLVGKWFQSKIYDQVSYERQVTEFIPMIVRKLGSHNDFSWTRISDLVIGDVILIKNLEVIPVDGILISQSADIDYSFVTGEKNPEQVQINDQVYTGGRQMSGEISIKLLSAPDEGRIWSTWAGTKKETDLQKDWTEKVAKYFTVGVLVVAAIAAMLWTIIDPSRVIFIVSSILIVACPCALALSAPFTFGNILRIFAKNNFYLKKNETISALSEINHFVFDKTGTLTEKRNENIEYEGKLLSDKELSIIKSVCSASSHPLSEGIARSINAKTLEVKQLHESPGEGIVAAVNDQLVNIGSATWLSQPNQTKSNGSAVFVAIDGKVLGKFYLTNKTRTDANQVLESLGRENKISLLSGDNESDREMLLKLYNNWNTLKFNLKPEDKSKQISAFQKSDKVAMFGDGINDTNALIQGDIGITVTENLNDFYPASDAVLLADDLGQLPSFIALSKYASKVLKIGFAFSLSYNIIGLGFAISGNLTPIVAAILMPISSVTVVALNSALVKLKAKKLQLR